MKGRAFLAILALLCIVCSCGDNIGDDYVSSTRNETDNSVLLELSADISKKEVKMLGVFRTGDQYGLRKYGFVDSKTNDAPVLFGSGCIYRPVSNIVKDTFSVSIPLSVGEVVYARAFVISDKNDTLYSEVDSCIIKKKLPWLETLPVDNRARRGAIVVGHFRNAGNVGLKSWGCCISEGALPTLEDKYEMAVDTAVDAVYHGEFGIFFDDLDENTLYHVRSYAITEELDTVYGEDRIFKTTFGGNFRWSWSTVADSLEAVEAKAEKNIKEAVDSAVYYYNNYTNLSKELYIKYDPSVPTADGNPNGNIRFGKNPTYQWVGTVQHEIAHTQGVGYSDWRSMYSDGCWTKPVALRTIRAMLMDQKQKLHGDNMHFWNCGINQKSEVTVGKANSYGVVIKGARVLKANAIIVNGMRIDISNSK